MGAEKKPNGRPRYYTDAAAIQKKIDDYYARCQGEILLDPEGRPVICKNGIVYRRPPEPLTVTGLAIALGFATRDAFCDYINRGNDSNATAEERGISDALIRARLRVEQYAEQRLYDRDGANGAKFNLANNFGWADKREVAVTDTMTPGDVDLLHKVAAKIDGQKD